MAEAMGRQPGGGPPVMIADGYRETERCCFCGGLTDEGIYVREDPAVTLCHGDHKTFAADGEEVTHMTDERTEQELATETEGFETEHEEHEAEAEGQEHEAEGDSPE